jgi:hypothetical protein
MRKHVVLVGLSSLMITASVAASGTARAEGPARTGDLGAALQPSSAWVLRVPLPIRRTAAPSTPNVAFTPSASRKLDDSGEYPDPRGMPIRRFYLESQLEQDFTVGGVVPMTSRMVAYTPDRAWQALDAIPAPIWQSDLVFRLPRDFYAGASVEQRTTAPRSVFVVAGERF